MIESVVPRRLERNKTVEMEKDVIKDSQDNNNSVNNKSLIDNFRPKLNTYKKYEYLNPFVYDDSVNPFDNPLEKYKIYAMTVLLVPIRAIGIVVSLLVAYMFATIGQFGCDIHEKPLTGWRYVFQQLTANSMRQIYASGSLHYLKVIGKQASFKEAPLLVIAPHSTFVDSLSVIAMGPPSIVAKQDTADIPLFGKIVNYAQPIYVRREDPNSRQNTIKQILERVNSKEDWPQTAIFPEGTCTNRKALITFKGGAFFPGVPVQPVILRYNNKFDSLTWTWKGPSILNLLWITLSQFYTKVEMEYLPVYKPTENEIKNPKLFADNVRSVMAKALNLPVSDYSIEDCFFLQEATNMKTPFSEDIVEIERCLNKLLLIATKIDESIASQLSKNENNFVDILVFSKMLSIDHKAEYTQRLFSLLRPNLEEKIDLKDFVLCSFFIKKVNNPIIDFLRLVVQVSVDHL
ncbi:LPCAT2 family protein [Megaselia abdita]